MVFGRVIAGRSVVRLIEDGPTKNDKPDEQILIAGCGQLKPDEPTRTDAADEFGDAFEDHPSDEEDDIQRVEVAVKIATQLKGPSHPSPSPAPHLTHEWSDIATKAFKKGDFFTATKKYTKALRYLDVHSVLPTDADRLEPDEILAFTALKLSLLLNVALSANKISPKPDPRLAIKSATRALNMHVEASELEDKQRDTPGYYRTLTPEERSVLSNLPLTSRALSADDRAKALYRRALAHATAKEDDEAVKDLESAHQLTPAEAVIKRELDLAKKRRADKKAREKAAYSKMFG